jgi:hypothetical protein
MGYFARFGFRVKPGKALRMGAGSNKLLRATISWKTALSTLIEHQPQDRAGGADYVRRPYRCKFMFGRLIRSVLTLGSAGGISFRADEFRVRGGFVGVCFLGG